MTALTRIRLFLRHAVPTLIMAGIHRRKGTGPPLDAPRILVTRLDGIGDFILTTPFLRELRRNYAHSHITLVVGRNSSNLAMACPHVNKVLFVDPDPAAPIFANPANFIPFVKYLQYLSDFADCHLAGRIDMAIQPRWDVDISWATLLTVLSGAPRRVGYTEKTSLVKSWCNFGHNLLFTEVIQPGIGQHESERNFDIIRYLGGAVESGAPEVWWQPEDQQQAEAFLGRENLSDAINLIVFGIGATQRRRQWPYYGELIRLLALELDFIPLLVAGPGEKELVDVIKAKSPSAVVMAIPLGPVAYILSRCTLFVGNDSGPMHLAAALGLAVVEISCHPVGGDPQHANSPDRFGPLASRKSIMRPQALSEKCRSGCVEDIPHCITGIRPEEVASAVMGLLRSIEVRTS